jgi:hypothetical protein
MALQQATGFCKSCDRQTMIQRPGTNHILHLILSVLTMGFWVVIWILASVKIGGWRCGSCGRGVSRSLFA